LVASYPYPQTHLAKRFKGRAHVRVQVGFPEGLRLPGLRTPQALGIKIETWSEELERLPVIHSEANRGTKHRGKRMPRDS